LKIAKKKRRRIIYNEHKSPIEIYEMKNEDDDDFGLFIFVVLIQLRACIREIKNTRFYCKRLRYNTKVMIFYLL
jgi:hypothetical protein